MAIPPFVRLEGFAYPPDGGLTAYRFLGSAFKHTIPKRRTGDKPVFFFDIATAGGRGVKTFVALRSSRLPRLPVSWLRKY